MILIDTALHVPSVHQAIQTHLGNNMSMPTLVTPRPHATPPPILAQG